ncbi:MAG: helix-turn-helix transcriptional regulator [Oscillospiraceae bacterium]|nr:helix-turn-helix transcriptional regulator [Oscillospiraceae bacterium]
MTLKERRLAAGLTQSEVAKSLNVDQGAVSNWERGINPPTRKYRAPLAQLYGCTVDELLKEDA